MATWQGVFLDFYGTLVGGDREAVETICQAVVDDHQLAVTATELSRLWGLAYFRAIEVRDGSPFRTLVEIERDTLVETLEPLVGRVDVDPYIERLNAYLAQPTLFEEVAEVLDALSVPVCIVSNADERELRLAVRHHDLPIENIVTSEFALSYKPDAGIFETALALTGWSRDRVIHVGDSLHSDVAGAQAVGLKAGWVKREGRIGDIGTAEPDFTWDDLRPIIQLTTE